MRQLFLCPVLVCLVAAATSHPLMSATQVRHAADDVDILVDGVSQQRYAHRGRSYVEALKGREYAIRIRNPYGVRVAVALSVDGLNTIDARETTAAAARKWVIDPYQTITISGWQTSRTDARRFEFTTEERSYGQALGRTANLGVISAVFFRERVVTTITRERDSSERRAGAPQSAPAAQESPADAAAAKASDEYAATGMGRRTNHVVTQVALDLEPTAAHTVDIRYEFRPQLIRLGILPATPSRSPLERRERAQGFEPGFSPEPPR